MLVKMDEGQLDSGKRHGHFRKRDRFSLTMLNEVNVGVVGPVDEVDLEKEMLV